MRIAVQGCSHGGLAQIYQTIIDHNARTDKPIDLLLLCGDFQALRSKHDFSSLAVPDKFKTLGTFHQYYSGEKVAPVLTIVIGGNHEASNYMWELYHGGWLAPSVYYLGAAGSVYVNGLRIVGASGIFKGFDYRKGHFEKVPYDKSQLRSIYHIRQYDVEKLMQLTPTPNTIFLSHDWPTTIPRFGDTQGLLRRKTFFAQEVSTDTLGSPPLLQLLDHIQPSYWFSAHLHVKFAALYPHKTPSHAPDSSTVARAVENPDEIRIDDQDDETAVPDEIKIGRKEDPGGANPDEIMLDDDEFMDNAGQPQEKGDPAETVFGGAEGDEPGPPDGPGVGAGSVPGAEAEAPSNPEEIAISDEEGEEIVWNPQAPSASRTAPLSAPPTALADASAPAPPVPAELATGYKRREKRQENIELHHDKSVDGATKFLALDKCGPGKHHMQFLEITDPCPPSIPGPPRITYDPEWLAVTRTFHPYLSTSPQPLHWPGKDVVRQMVQDELKQIQDEGLLVPNEREEEALVVEKGKVDVGRVQRFWWTAPPEGQPGGDPNMWYTNPQTEAFCGMLGLKNKINPS